MSDGHVTPARPCHACQALLDDGDKFCRWCGIEVPPADELLAEALYDAANSVLVTDRGSTWMEAGPTIRASTRAVVAKAKDLLGVDALKVERDEALKSRDLALSDVRAQLKRNEELSAHCSDSVREIRAERDQLQDELGRLESVLCEEFGCWPEGAHTDVAGEAVRVLRVLRRGELAFRNQVEGLQAEKEELRTTIELAAHQINVLNDDAIHSRELLAARAEPKPSAGLPKLDWKDLDLAMRSLVACDRDFDREAQVAIAWVKARMSGSRALVVGLEPRGTDKSSAGLPEVGESILVRACKRDDFVARTVASIEAPRPSFQVWALDGSVGWGPYYLDEEGEYWRRVAQQPEPTIKREPGPCGPPKAGEPR